MKGKITFNKSGTGSKSGRLTIPVAILELMKIGVLTVRQEEIFGDIILDSLEN